LSLPLWRVLLRRVRAGAEAGGLPPHLLRLATPVQIPSMSASINVGCAFAMVLAVMTLARIGQPAST